MTPPASTPPASTRPAPPRAPWSGRSVALAVALALSAAGCRTPHYVVI